MYTNYMNQTAYQNTQTINVIRQRCAHTFWQLLLIGKWRRLWQRLWRKPTNLLDLNNFWLTKKISTRHHLGLRNIAISQIVGSEGRVQDFDISFFPRQLHNRDRWISIAVAKLMGKTLPPVNLVKICDNYFIRDGHHRISVARALGQLEIDAEVVEWQVD